MLVNQRVGVAAVAAGDAVDEHAAIADPSVRRDFEPDAERAVMERPGLGKAVERRVQRRRAGRLDEAGGERPVHDRPRLADMAVQDDAAVDRVHRPFDPLDAVRHAVVEQGRGG